MENRDISSKKLKVERAKNKARHSISHCIDSRRIQAIARGMNGQAEHFLVDDFLENHSRFLPNFDIVDLVIRGRVFC